MTIQVRGGAGRGLLPLIELTGVREKFLRVHTSETMSGDEHGLQVFIIHQTFKMMTAPACAVPSRDWLPWEGGRSL